MEALIVGWLGLDSLFYSERIIFRIPSVAITVPNRSNRCRFAARVFAGNIAWIAGFQRPCRVALLVYSGDISRHRVDLWLG